MKLHVYISANIERKVYMDIQCRDQTITVCVCEYWSHSVVWVCLLRAHTHPNLRACHCFSMIHLYTMYIIPMLPLFKPENFSFTCTTGSLPFTELCCEMVCSPVASVLVPCQASCLHVEIGVWSECQGCA